MFIGTSIREPFPYTHLYLTTLCRINPELILNHRTEGLCLRITIRDTLKARPMVKNLFRNLLGVTIFSFGLTPAIAKNCTANTYTINVPPAAMESIALEGANEGAYNVLRWTIHTQINNNSFVLERSLDGVLFEAIASIDGAIAAVQPINYLQIDAYPYAGDNYYRLRKTNSDGQFTYSNVVAVNYNPSQVFIENVNSNPSSTSVSFDFITPQNTDIQIVIMDVTGRIVVDEVQNVLAGRNRLSTALDNCPAGTYTLQVVNKQLGYSSTSRIIHY